MEALQGVVIRSIDLGYGNVKYTVQHRDAFSTVECEIFPSRSPVAGGKGLTAGIVQTRDTVVVNVHGTEYEVGHGVTKAQGTFDESAVLDKDFCLSDAYLARLRGALFYMMGTDKAGEKYFSGNHIGLLMVGLPVSTYRNEELRNKLKVILTGTHELPNGRTVIVDRVLVMPQPLGAFFEYAFDKGMFDTMRDQTNLIIDPGFFTFDWLLSAGLTPIDARSDSVNRGMSAVIKAIAEAAKKKEGWSADTGMLTRMLDEHFRDGKPFIVYGNEHNVDDYVGAGKGVINEAVAALANSVGDGADIHNIILAGGGAMLYLDAIKEKFPRHKILVMDNPVFSNVRGFQLAGEQQTVLRLRRDRMANKSE
jgi:plasmid segregation protein ParM